MNLNVACMVLLAALSAQGTERLPSPLYCLVKEADLVVAGEIVNKPFGTSTEDGVVEYAVELKVTEILKGDAKAQESLRTVVVRFEKSGGGDELPLLKKGTKCILFLRPLAKFMDIQFWRTVDMHFGFQFYNSKMAEHVKAVVEAEAKKKDAKERR